MTAELLTTADVAERLKISPETVAIYASKGEFPGSFKIGIRWRIPKNAIDDYIRAKRGIKHPDSSPNAIAPRSTRARNRRKAS
ncbi:helix-turn-helix domain-containing protein [Arcanobacterium buesumense]|uniref:Helix-turn-helix domain-containing protein n=1 Tax=Arcanobacterium buesumense TaxID=2722751 RepID=A0A6H2ELU5_9ACTO|nr:helix-turn-helix domain-containing protein [Arcanobacterium buesumense]